MSLDTVLKIGKAFRASKDGLKHFRYVNPCPQDTDKQTVIRLCLPLKEDFSFDFDNLAEIINQNIIGSDTKDTELYYLTFKTSDKDNNPIKYIFSDIYYGCEKGKEKGWYKTERKIKVKKSTKKEPEKTEITVNSFYEGNKSDKPFCDRITSKIDRNNPNAYLLKKFRESFEENIDKIENDILKKFTAKSAFENIKSSSQANKKLKELFGNERYNILWDEIEQDSNLIEILLKKEKGRVFLHFDFSKVGAKKYWYEYAHIFEAISAQIREEMTDEVIVEDKLNQQKLKAFIFKKELYRNICSGDSQGDKQFPNFNNNNRYKSFFFSEEDVENLYYGINSTERGLYLGKDLITIILLPNGNKLSANHYEDFQRAITSRSDKSQEDKNEESETVIKRNNENVFDFLNLLDEDDSISEITTFDVIFVNKGRNSDSDLIEISNIERSFLNQVFQSIKSVKKDLYQKITAKERFEKGVSILYSLQQILGNGQTDKNSGKIQFKTNPRYNAHLLKILPKIYTANYTEDNLLLPAFIENVEYSIRHGDAKFSFLKYDLEFLLSIQNTNPYKLNYMKITESQNYQIGLLLGRLARNFAGENSPIKSFEKNYVGNLTRRIATLNDFITLKNEVEEKLIIHEKTNYTFKDSNDLAEKIKQFEGKYDKNECAFGFFESYFDRPSKKTFIEKIENVLEKGKADTANNELIEQITSVLSNFKN